jgi:MYXO-CTERM domain-containing protein
MRVLAAAAMLLAIESSASAYCRMTTEQPREECGPCTNGIPLAWPATPFVLSIRDAGHEPLAFDAMHSAVEQASRQWTEALCPSDGLPSVFGTVGDEPTSADPSRDGIANVVAILSRQEWVEDTTLDERQFALTRSWYYESRGEIFEADVVVSPNQGCDAIDCEGLVPAICGDGGCAPGEYDVLAVLTHELGHVYGLSHTEPGGDENATMQCRGADLGKRTLEADDVAGICAIYPPGQRAAGAGFEGSCSASGDPGGWPLFAIGLVIGLALRRWTRRPRALDARAR